jgi:uncharacterized damage-inducible protein DinB
MTTKEILLEQFKTCYDENGWFVALKNAVNNLSAEDAAWKPIGADNSIWGILAHLNFYNERYLKKFRGEQVEKLDLDNSETFAGEENATEEAWASEIERFDRVMNGWREAIEAASDARLAEQVSNKHPNRWANVIADINAHNAHHGGQIVILRKLQGSWDAAKGVS